jgi:predicted nucleic acid-binding protein
VLVVDASVVAPAVADAGPDGRAFRRRLRGEVVAGPDVVRVEALSAIRRGLLASSLTVTQAKNAVEDLLVLPLVIYPTGPLLRRVWELRDNLSAYDACYVALAEAIDCPLVTADRRLGRAPGSRCAIEIL